MRNTTNRIVAIFLSLVILCLIGGVAYAEREPLQVFESSTALLYGGGYPQWTKPLPSWTALVNSKYAQPRSTGTNPHRGVDLHAATGTTAYAVYSGKLTHTGTGMMEIQCDMNGDSQITDQYDGGGKFLACNYTHMSNRSAPGYYTKGAVVGKTGGSPAHLHFGALRGPNGNANNPQTNAGLTKVWSPLRRLYAWGTNYNSGNDFDAVGDHWWTLSNRLYIRAYIWDDGVSYSYGNAKLYYFMGKFTHGDPYEFVANMTYVDQLKAWYVDLGNYPPDVACTYVARFERTRNIGNAYPYTWTLIRYDQPPANPNGTDRYTRMRLYPNTQISTY